MQSRTPALIPAILLSLALAGCSGIGLTGGGSSGVVSPPDPGAGGGAVGGGGVGVAPAPGNGGGGDPADGMRPSIETPAPGQVDPRPVTVWKITPNLDGRHLTVLLAWWSGPAPCSVLDSVAIARDGDTFTITPREGSAPAAGGQVACPAIAMLHGTIVDLGDLPAGTYTLAAPGDLAPVVLVVP